jgi:hypothetical protein
VTWVDDPELEATLLRRIDHDSPLNDNPQYLEPDFLAVSSDRARMRRDLSYARQRLASLAASDPDFGRTFDLALNFIVSPTSRYPTFGGTTTSAIGVIFLCDADRLRPEDLDEFLVHELTHTLVFIFEMSFSLYDYDLISKPDNYCVAALTRQVRPLDKVVHSIIVSAELVARRRAHPGGSVFYHRSTQRLVAGGLASIAHLRQMPNCNKLLHKGAWWLIDHAEQELRFELNRTRPIAAD